MVIINLNIYKFVNDTQLLEQKFDLICMQVRKQQLELDMEQQTGSK